MQDSSDIARLRDGLGGLVLSEAPDGGHSVTAAFCKAVFGTANQDVVKQCHLLAVRSLIDLCRSPANIQALEEAAGCSLAELLLRVGTIRESGGDIQRDISVRLASLCRELSVNVLLHVGKIVVQD
jgi:hypothetical protein